MCVGTERTVEAIRARGLALVHDGERTVTHPEAVVRLEEPVSLLVVAVKAYDLDEALGRVEPSALRDAVVLPLLNGLEHVERIRASERALARAGAAVVAGSIGRVEAYAAEPGVVVQRSPGALVTAAGDAVDAARLDAALGPLRVPGIDVVVATGERAVLWEKAARLAVLAAATVASGLTVGALRDGPGLARASARGARRGVRGRRRRRRPARPGRSMGDHRRLARGPHHLDRARRPRGASHRARRDHRLGRAGRRAARRPDPRARGAPRGGAMPSAVALIGARAGSERVPGKNVRQLAGHPLLAYAIETARQSGVFERIVVSTDSEAIAKVARWYGADVPFLRPAEYATATSPDIDWIAWTLPRLDEHFDLFAIVRATNPFRGPDVVRRGLEQLLATPEADSIRAVELVKQHPGKMWVLDEVGRLMRPLLDQSHLDVAWHAGQYQALPPVYVQNSALEIAWTRVVAATGTREGRMLAPFLTEGYEGLNIDDEDDFARAEQLVATRAWRTLPSVGRRASVSSRVS